MTKLSITIIALCGGALGAMAVIDSPSSNFAAGIIIGMMGSFTTMFLLLSMMRQMPHDAPGRAQRLEVHEHRHMHVHGPKFQPREQIGRRPQRMIEQQAGGQRYENRG